MAQEISLLAPSGQLLALGLPDYPLVSSYTASARYAGEQFARALQIGALGFHDAGNQSIMPAEITDRFVVNGREVRVATGIDGENASVALIGDYHEVVTVFGGPPPEREEVISMFEMFAFEDAPEGMMIIPQTALSLVGEAMSIYVDGRGTITIPSNEFAMDLRPPHMGTPTRYGELWISDGQLPDRTGDGANTFVYLLGTDLAIAEIIFPDTSEFHDIEHPTPTDEELLDWLYELNPRWGG